MKRNCFVFMVKRFPSRISISEFLQIILTWETDGVSKFFSLRLSVMTSSSSSSSCIFFPTVTSAVLFSVSSAVVAFFECPLLSFGVFFLLAEFIMVVVVRFVAVGCFVSLFFVIVMSLFVFSLFTVFFFVFSGVMMPALLVSSFLCLVLVMVFSTLLVSSILVEFVKELGLLLVLVLEIEYNHFSFKINHS